MADDLEARLILLQQVTDLVEKPEAEGGTGLLVVPELGFGTEEEALSAHYIFTIHDQILSRCLGLNYGVKHVGQFTQEVPNLTRLGSYSVISGPDVERHGHLIEFLLKAQVEWVDLPEARTAAAAFRHTEAATEEVRRHLERLRLAVGFPPGSRCDACDPRLSPSVGVALEVVGHCNFRYSQPMGDLTVRMPLVPKTPGHLGLILGRPSLSWLAGFPATP